VRRDGLPRSLVLDAWTEDGLVMAMHHATSPTFGVQFHPESFRTPDGERVLATFARVAQVWRARRRGGTVRAAPGLPA
jgi:anthranilate/para-aminobenzoate synthase component II